MEIVIQIVILIILILIIIGQGTMYTLFKKKLENDYKIIDRLDILLKELNNKSKDRE